MWLYLKSWYTILSVEERWTNGVKNRFIWIGFLEDEYMLIYFTCSTTALSIKVGSWLEIARTFSIKFNIYFSFTLPADEPEWDIPCNLIPTLMQCNPRKVLFFVSTVSVSITLLFNCIFYGCQTFYVFKVPFEACFICLFLLALEAALLILAFF
jgi:hypothetical protein